jgi:HlyD family secretion protein
MAGQVKTTITVALLVIVVAVLAGAWWQYLRQEPLPEGLVQANGRIEGDHYTVAGKVPGKIAAIMAREGEAVVEDQVLAQLDDVQVRAKVAQAKQQVAAAEAQCQAATATEQQARRDKDRLSQLYERGSAAKREAERTHSAWTVARSQLDAADAQCEAAKAMLLEVQSVLADLTIHAPANGTITTRIADKGEVVAAGSPLFDIVDLDRLYLKVYIPEKVIGKVRLGLPARVYTDAFPDKPFLATVRYIASQAEFTPKEVQTPDERVKLVYAVKLYLDENPEHRLTPGLPADAVIRWQEGVEWANPRW